MKSCSHVILPNSLFKVINNVTDIVGYLIIIFKYIVQIHIVNVVVSRGMTWIVFLFLSLL